MSVTCHSFGVTRRGEAVTAWQLSNHTGTSVTVLDYGATVQSLCVPDRAGRLTDVVLGYPTALLPLPALLCTASIAVMAFIELIQQTPLDLGHGADVE